MHPRDRMFVYGVAMQVAGIVIGVKVGNWIGAHFA